MDLGAYAIGMEENIGKWLENVYGYIPRFRGCRFMKIENKMDDDYSYQAELFNSYVGQDVIYIHTRCGGEVDELDSNYMSCGGYEFENNNKETFLDGITDEFDCTYRDHYFKAPVNDDNYHKIIQHLDSIRKK